MWEMLASAALSAATGAYGANRAASEQEDAAKRQQDTNYRTFMANALMSEPERQRAYDAGAAIDSFYGWNTSPYTPLPQIQNQMTRLGAGEVKAALRGGATFEQLQGMGTLGDVSGKQYKRLSRFLTPEQIQILRSGPSAPAAAPAATAGPAAGPQPSGADWLKTMPGYQFGIDTGRTATQQSAAARTGVLNGNTIKALEEFGQNYGQTFFDRELNRLLQIKSGSSGGVSGTGSAITGYGNSLMDSQRQIGDARASGVMGVVNTATNAINAGMNNYLLNKYLTQQSAPPASVSPFGPYAGGYNFPGGTPPYLPPGIGGN